MSNVKQQNSMSAFNYSNVEIVCRYCGQPISPTPEFKEFGSAEHDPDKGMLYTCKSCLDYLQAPVIVTLTADEIEAVITKGLQPGNHPILSLHEMVLGEEQWDRVVHMNQYVICDEKSWKFICNRFIALDQENNTVGCSNSWSMMWVNIGFSCDKDKSGDDKLQDWQFKYYPHKITYKQ